VNSELADQENKPVFSPIIYADGSVLIGTRSRKGPALLVWRMAISKCGPTNTFRLPVVDAFRTFCVNPSPEGSALLSGVRNLTFLGLIGQSSGQGIKMRAALYARVSTQHKGQETANQLSQLRECCQAQHWSVLQEYEDHEPGGKSERAAFQQMLRDEAARRFDVLFFWSPGPTD
jgi:resolvase-like protein